MNAFPEIDIIFLPGSVSCFPDSVKILQRQKARFIDKAVFPGFQGTHCQRAAQIRPNGTGYQINFRCQDFSFTLCFQGLRVSREECFNFFHIWIINLPECCPRLQKAVCHGVNVPVIQPDYREPEKPLFHNLMGGSAEFRCIIHSVCFLHFIPPFSLSSLAFASDS